MIVIRPATSEDVPAIAGLLEELERHYGTTEFDPIEQRRAEINTALYARRDPGVHVDVARDEAGTVVGLASYSYLWPAAGVTRSLYLKELYVAENRRGQGVGRMLMAHIRKVATAEQCSRIEWTTDTDSVDAQRFYEHLGYKPSSGKLFYRLTLD